MTLFYTDPLKAAWMEREFGVRLVDASGLKVLVDIGINFRQFVVFTTKNGKDYKEHCLTDKAFVADDSLSIFNPQDGDKNIAGYTFNAELQGWEKECPCGDVVIAKLPHELDIHMRNGKVFFWPEREG